MYWNNNSIMDLTTFFKGTNKSSSPVNENGQIQGTPKAISKYVYDDIQLVKQDIKKFNEQTNVLHSHFYYKLYKLIEQSQEQQLNKLKRSSNYVYDDPYYKKLVGLYKEFVKELDDFLQLLKNNYHNGILKSSISEGTSADAGSIPEDLVDPLSYELFHDPVVTPSGITYEKSYIMDHLSKNGKFDPLTRADLKPSQLYPNLAIKNSVNNYVQHITTNKV